MRTADNGIGWQVEQHTTNGWIVVSLIYATRDLAESALAQYQQDGAECRVYEALA